MKKEPYVRKRQGETLYDNISYGDVTRKSWQSKRVTNPLTPRYKVWDTSVGEFGKPAESKTLNHEYGLIEGS